MSKLEFATLNPVVLGNDDFNTTEETFVRELYRGGNFNDGEETSVKQIYTSTQDISLQCGQDIVVSQGTRVNVTHDNVAAIFNEINPSQSDLSDTPDNSEQQSKQFQSLIQLYRDLPRDLFVNRIQSDYNSDERLLYQLRGDLFSKLKESDKYSFVPGIELKRRKKTPRGDSVDLKLCADVFVLISVLDGASADDLKDLFSSSKYASQTENDNDESMLASAGTPMVSKRANENCDLDIQLLRNAIAAVQADVLGLKQDNSSACDELKNFKTELNSFKSECVAEINKLKKSVADCAQSIDRICDEGSNGIATIKSDVRQIRSDVTSIDETLDLRCIELGNKISALNKHEKRIVKLENKLCKRQELSDNSTQFVSEENSASSSSQSTMTDSVAKQKEFVAVPMNTKTSDSSNLLPGLGKVGLYKSPESLRIKRAPTLPVQHSLVKNNDLINFSPPPRLNELTSSKSGSHNETVANSPADSTSHGHDKSPDNHGAIRKNAFDDEQHTDNGQTTAISGTTIPLMGNGISAVPNGSVSGIPVMISERNSERQDNRPPTRSRYGKDQPSKQLRVIPTGSPEEDNDDDFVIHVRRRTKRFYVGGFLPSITEKKIN